MSDHNTVVKQHYVPVFYLSNFTFDCKRLFVYDKKNRKVISKVGVRDIAHSKFFYDLPKVDESEPDDHQMVEKALQNLEGKFAGAIREVLCLADGDQLPDELRVGMSFLMSHLYMRTLDFRNELEELLSKSMTAMMNEHAADELPGFKPEDAVKVALKPWALQVWHLQTMLDNDHAKGFADALHQHIWTVGIAPDGHLFYSSDSPLVRVAHVRNSAMGTTGLSSPGCQ